MFSASGGAPIFCCCAEASPSPASKQTATIVPPLTQPHICSTPLFGTGLLPAERTVTRGRSRQNTLLTCNLLVAYCRRMDEVFKALADPSRRSLLDRLHAKNG